MEAQLEKQEVFKFLGRQEENGKKTGQKPLWQLTINKLNFNGWQLFEK